ncbi:MAG: CDP-diacylglycerol--glycerol-3-phosphate 3-phosphatidyltransferase, partial [Nitrospirae bacterium]|nr:CDP-diacylglycerol--glycerol-3-phosphate 3-phosphatidyltransferase [Nitrospirota bacterium]
MNLPNLLTLLRIALIPLFVMIYSEPTPLRSFLATVAFLLAALTDFLDGYLARKRGEITQFGKLMDPIADKLLVISALLLLVYFQRIPVWMVIILVGREMAVTGLRAVASLEGVIIPADRWGKYKMGAQITALALLLWNLTFPLDFQFWGIFFLWIALFLSIFSGFQYFINYARA